MATRHTLCAALTLVIAVAARSYGAELILVENEIDDDHIIIARSNGERLLLEKWTLRFSPLNFEGETFPADVSAMWVTIYFDDRDEIKWSIEENLGRAAPPRTTAPPSPKELAQAAEPLLLAQAALALLGYEPGPLDGAAGAKTTAALKSFQKAEQLPQDGKPGTATLIALSTQLYRRYPDDQRVLGIAAALLTTSSLPRTGAGVPPQAEGVIESHIEGEFEGWEGETVFVLDNGQIWQQSSYAYTYHYAYRPKVIIYPSAGGHKLVVEGVSGSIHVKRLK